MPDRSDVLGVALLFPDAPAKQGGGAGEGAEQEPDDVMMAHGCSMPPAGLPWRFDANVAMSLSPFVPRHTPSPGAQPRTRMRLTREERW